MSASAVSPINNDNVIMTCRQYAPAGQLRIVVEEEARLSTRRPLRAHRFYKFTLVGRKGASSQVLATRELSARDVELGFQEVDGQKYINEITATDGSLKIRARGRSSTVLVDFPDSPEFAVDGHRGWNCVINL